MELRQREPREECPAFLAFVRQHACCICARPGPSQAAHISMACKEIDKRYTGMGEKAHDRYCTPMCDEHHLSGREAQHKMGERKFWRMHGLDPFKIAGALWDQFIAQGGKVPDQRIRRSRPPTRPTQSRPIPQRANPWPPKGSRPFRSSKVFS